MIVIGRYTAAGPPSRSVAGSPERSAAGASTAVPLLSKGATS